MVEQRVLSPCVAGSSPAASSINERDNMIDPAHVLAIAILMAFIAFCLVLP